MSPLIFYSLCSAPALEVLGELACRPAFRAWELHDSKESMRIERELMKEHKGVRCLELLHQAAFRYVMTVSILACVCHSAAIARLRTAQLRRSTRLTI